jgi:hypothetical protein
MTRVATQGARVAKEIAMPRRRPNPLPSVPKPETPGLLRLVHDLLEHREVRTRFNTSPSRVARDYDLKPAEEGALFSMDGAKIGKEIGAQLAGITYAFMENEFPVLSPHFAPDPGVTVQEYPSPKPEIFRISPRTVKAGSGQFEFNVFGQSFSHDAAIELTLDGGTQTLAVSKSDVFGTFRCSHAWAVVTAPSSPGSYKIAVVNSPSSSNKTRIEGPGTLRLVVDS